MDILLVDMKVESKVVMKVEQMVAKSGPLMGYQLVEMKELSMVVYLA
jgi:hypothetical protein